MRRVLKILFRVLALLVIVAVVAGIWKREEITRLLAVNSLFTEEKIVGNFSNMNKAFLTRDVDRGSGPVSDIPQGETMQLP